MTKQELNTLPQYPTKKERLEARVTLEFKERLEQAAAIKGVSITTFVVQQLEKATEEVLSDYQHRRYSQADQEIFLNALLNPPMPNARLKVAAKRYFSE